MTLEDGGMTLEDDRMTLEDDSRTRKLCDDEVAIILSYLPYRRFMLRSYYVDFIRKAPDNVLVTLLDKGGDSLLSKVMYETGRWYGFNPGRHIPSSWYGDDPTIFMRLYTRRWADIINRFPDGLSRADKDLLLKNPDIEPMAYIRLLRDVPMDVRKRSPSFINAILSIDDTVVNKVHRFGEDFLVDNISTVFDCPDRYHASIDGYNQVYREDSEVSREDLIHGMMSTATMNGMKLGTGVCLMSLLQIIERLEEKVDDLQRRWDRSGIDE